MIYPVHHHLGSQTLIPREMQRPKYIYVAAVLRLMCAVNLPPLWNVHFLSTILNPPLFRVPLPRSDIFFINQQAKLSMYNMMRALMKLLYP